MPKIQESPEYSIGLDIGTNSVGWCVTNPEYDILTFKRRKMWGVRKFSEGEAAAARRVFRTTRRRLQRRRARIKLIQDLIGQAVLERDPSFFIRMHDSFLHQEDRQEKCYYNLFVTPEYTDKQYFKDYPTPYHLRAALMESTEKMDIRLIYLAIHHIAKYRGHFLYAQEEFSATSREQTWEILERLANDFDADLDRDGLNHLCSILYDKGLKKQAKKDALKDLLGKKGKFLSMLCCAVGLKTSLQDMFGEEFEKKDSLKLGDENVLETNQDKLGDYFPIAEQLYAVFSSITLDEIMKGESTISAAMIKRYEEHKEDLKQLKSLVREKYGQELYDELFKRYINGKNTYKGGLYGMYVSAPAMFNGVAKKGNAPQTIRDLLKTRLERDTADFTEDARYQYCMERIEDGTFLMRINDTSNIMIPNQLHRDELREIIKCQAPFHPALQDHGDSLVKIVRFRIPYYVGPLNNHSGKYWSARKEGKIDALNFDEMVDHETSAEGFINRMRNFCTYLPGEETLPRHSLAYSEYAVLNELNNVRVNGDKLDPAVKRDVLEKLFQKQKTVTTKAFKQFLANHHFLELQDEKLGLSDPSKFTNSLVSHIAFTKILGEITPANRMFVERVIRDLALFEDKKLLRNRIVQAAAEYRLDLTEDQVAAIERLPFRGWGSLSGKLIDGLRTCKDTTILEELRLSKYNFMQIVTSEKLGIKEQIEALEKEYYGDNKKSAIEAIDELPGSPAIKKGIRQTFKILDELTRIAGKSPKSIFLEVAREEGKKQRTKSRYDKVRELYESNPELRSEEVFRELRAHSDQKDALTKDRLFLYFLQHGKCMYTGSPLNIESLHNYHIDHILPQALIKDDSLENRVLVLSQSNAQKTDSMVLSAEVRNGMRPFWEQLRRQGLLSSRKYFALTRADFSQEDIEGFINRQLVETRQITKHITALLKAHYPDVQVVMIKGRVTSDFRKKYGIPKVRALNDFHHAHDAYIVSILGNTVATSADWLIREYEHGSYNYRAVREQVSNPQNKDGYLLTLVGRSLRHREGEVKKRFLHRDILLTHQLETSYGELYNQTRYPRSSKLMEKAIPLKKGLDPKKYGGFSGENQAYYSAVEYTDQRGRRKKELVGIPIRIAIMIHSGKLALKDYLGESGYSSPEVLQPKIKKYQKIIWNGGEYRIVSSSEIINDKPLFLRDERNLALLEAISKKGVDLEMDGGLNESLDNIYQELSVKLSSNYPRMRGVAEKIAKSFGEFRSLTPSEKVRVILELLKITQTNPSLADLSLLGLRAGLGRMPNVPIDLEVAEFVSQSPTGLFERRYRL